MAIIFWKLALTGMLMGVVIFLLVGVLANTTMSARQERFLGYGLLLIGGWTVGFGVLAALVWLWS